MMGRHCYLCRLTYAGFQDLLVQGEPWTWKKMEDIAAEVASESFKGQAKEGIKELPWWTFIPLHHFLPPLLHLMMGIWNDIWDRFRDNVSEKIEYISKGEADLRGKEAELL